jgi:hypothetical protein
LSKTVPLPPATSASAWPTIRLGSLPIHRACLAAQLRILGRVGPTPISSLLEAMSDACSTLSRYSGLVKCHFRALHREWRSRCQNGVKSERPLSSPTMTKLYYEASSPCTLLSSYY